MNAQERFSIKVKSLVLGAMVAALFAALLFPAPALAASAPLASSVTLSTGSALSVVQQPQNDPRFVSREKNAATQFSMAAKLGNVGLLAHNTLAGAQFGKLALGDKLTVSYSDGRTETFVVTAALRYQVLPNGKYLDLSSGATQSAGDVFHAAYGGAYHLTLQTCITADGNNEWGRLFIIAQPMAQ